jgi:HAD superfamily hydrolase (TIGR01509 family)
MAKLHALIFDVDGTLAETEQDGHRVAFNQAFALAGLEWHWSIEFYGELLEIAGGKERIQHYVRQYQPNFEPPTPLPEFAATLHRQKTKQYQQLLTAGLIPLRTGVKRILKEAREQGIRLAIATTSSPENVTALLEQHLGSESPTWFDIIAAGDVVPQKKPAPDIYFYVLDALNLPPQACIAIEDSQQGLTAARLAEIPTIITVNSYTQHHNFQEAALVINHLGEPDHPFEVLAGNTKQNGYLTVEFLKQFMGTL